MLLISLCYENYLGLLTFKTTYSVQWFNQTNAGKSYLQLTHLLKTHSWSYSKERSPGSTLLLVYLCTIYKSISKWNLCLFAYAKKATRTVIRSSFDIVQSMTEPLGITMFSSRWLSRAGSKTIFICPLTAIFPFIFKPWSLHGLLIKWP